MVGYNIHIRTHYYLQFLYSAIFHSMAFMKSMSLTSAVDGDKELCDRGKSSNINLKVEALDRALTYTREMYANVHVRKMYSVADTSRIKTLRFGESNKYSSQFNKCKTCVLWNT